jgi:hypothetical protein
MTQRSIRAGKSPTVIVRAGMDVRIEGWDDERVFASTGHKWGLKLERGSGSGLGRFRARAAIGDLVLFDVKGDLLKRKAEPELDDAIQVQSGGDATVRVPYDSAVKVYAGKGVEVRGVRGDVAVYAGGSVRVQDVPGLNYVTAGGAIDLDCATFAGEDARFQAGRDLRFYAHDLDDATILVDDLGGEWEAIIGDGGRQIELKAGGDVVLVTDQLVRSGSPDGAMGQIEAPPSS